MTESNTSAVQESSSAASDLEMLANGLLSEVARFTPPQGDSGAYRGASRARRHPGPPNRARSRDRSQTPPARARSPAATR